MGFEIKKLKIKMEIIYRTYFRKEKERAVDSCVRVVIRNVELVRACCKIASLECNIGFLLPLSASILSLAGSCVSQKLINPAIFRAPLATRPNFYPDPDFRGQTLDI